MEQRRDSNKSNCSDKGDASTPTGVNRRTAVLFTKKSCHRRSSGSNTTQSRKAPGRPPRTRIPSSPGPCGGPQLDDDSDIGDHDDGEDSADVPTPKKSCRKDTKNASAKSPGSRKRSVSIASLDKDGAGLPSPKRMANGGDTSTPSKQDGAFFAHQQKESFMQYRNRSHAISDMDTTSESGSTDSLMSGSESTRETSSESGDEKESSSHHRYSKRGRTLSFQVLCKMYKAQTTARCDRKEMLVSSAAESGFICLCQPV